MTQWTRDMARLYDEFHAPREFPPFEHERTCPMTIVPEHDPILDCPMAPNDADAATVREYLQSLLDELVRYGEGFSSKRPFGNSGWEREMPQAIVIAGLAKDEDDAGTKLLEAIRRL